MNKTIAIIPARGGSKGIPRKNLKLICGKPLLAWSIIQARQAKLISNVYVSSDNDEILAVAAEYGAIPIHRPISISGDSASSESAWLHAVQEIEGGGVKIDYVIGMQATSPIRESSDLEGALSQVKREELDSLFTVTEVEDYFGWREGPNGPESIDHDYLHRKRRQKIERRYLENGSFYIFKPEILRINNNRLGGKMGMFVMDRFKMFQIDNEPDLFFCETIMHGYGLDNL
jgi:CMP-N,N'-diacetyllegionaminic acid synthase